MQARNLKRALVAATPLALVGQSQAAAVDVAAIVTDIGAQVASIVLVGAAT